MKALAKQFHELDQDNDGVINFEEFCQIIGDMNTGELATEYKTSASQLFSLFDMDKSGGINFREFVVAVGVFSHRCTAVDTAKVVFLIFDIHSNNEIDKKDFQDLLSEMVSQTGKAEVEVVFHVDQLVDALFKQQTTLSEEEFTDRLSSQPYVVENILELFLYKRVGKLLPQQNLDKKE